MLQWHVPLRKKQDGYLGDILYEYIRNVLQWHVPLRKKQDGYLGRQAISGCLQTLTNVLTTAQYVAFVTHDSLALRAIKLDLLYKV